MRILGLIILVTAGTNAKIMEEEGKMGVRVVGANGEGIVEGDEIERCLESVMMGKKGEELRKRGKEWQVLAKGAVREGGTSDANLRTFMDHVVAGN